MTGSSWVTTTDRALLEVTLEDIAPGERIIAQDAHVWSVASVYT